MTQQRLVEDRLRKLLEPLLPGRRRRVVRVGVRGSMTGRCWRGSGSSCRPVPLQLQLGHGSGHTAWRRLRAWQDAGVWDRLHQLVIDGQATSV